MKRIIVLFAAVSMLASCSDKSADQTETQSVLADNKEIKSSAPSNLPMDSTSHNNGTELIPLSLSGVITAAPDRHASVTVLMGGTIAGINVRPGQYVNKGHIIATLDNPEFVELQQTYLETSAQTEFLEAEYLRQQTLAKSEVASQKKLQQSKAEYLSMKSRMDASATRLRQLGVSPAAILSHGIRPSLTVAAPISGYVADMDANIGRYLSTGDRICEVIDRNETMLMLTAYEKDLNAIEEKQHWTFTANGLPGKTFEAVVSHIDRAVDKDTRSVKVYARVTCGSEQFRTGMYVRATMQ